jgi:hypothetical protein
VVSERNDDQVRGRNGRDEDRPRERLTPPAEDPATAYALRRRNRIRRLKELVQEADYDIPADVVAARIIRDALFGAPDADEPS